MREPYGFAALLSLFVPGLGQICKGQWTRALFAWLTIATIWAVYGLIAFLAMDRVRMNEFRYQQTVQLAYYAAVLPALATVATWLWLVVDAYREPVAP